MSDLHSDTARKLFGNVTPATRRLAKEINFAKAYGGDPATLTAKAGLMPHQAELIRLAHQRRWPLLYPSTGKTRDELPRMQPVKGHIIDEIAVGDFAGFEAKIAGFFQSKDENPHRLSCPAIQNLPRPNAATYLDAC